MAIKRGRYAQKDFQYVLEYRMPGPSSELRSALVDTEDDEDEIDESEQEPDVDPAVLMASISALEGSDTSGAAGAELIRCVGDDVVAMEFVLEGERSKPFPGVDVEVSFEHDGRCLVHVSDRDVEVKVLEEAGEERRISPESLEGEPLEVPSGTRASVKLGDRLLLIRPVTASGQSVERRIPTALVVTAFLLGGLVIVVLALAFLAWGLSTWQ